MSYSPLVLVPDITKISHEEWLLKRKQGIGGSDAPKIMGVSSFGTARDVFWQKRSEDNYFTESINDFVQKEIGHLLEPMVAKIFELQNPGWKVYKDNRMVCHPVHTFMLADIDYYTIDPRTGKKYILECKTTSEEVLKKKWGNKNSKKYPEEYDWQCRHYMAVHNVDGVFLCCLAGNSISGFRQRFIARDMYLEEQLIKTEKTFWNSVVTNTPPKVERLKTVIYHYAPSKASSKILKITTPDISIYEFLELQRKSYKEKISEIEKKQEQIKTRIFDALKGEKGIITDGTSIIYHASTKENKTEKFDNDMLINFKLEYPDAYDKYVKKQNTVSISLKRKR